MTVLPIFFSIPCFVVGIPVSVAIFRLSRFIAPDSEAMTEGGEEQYIANSRLKLSLPLNFIRVWETVKDKINDNWETLRPKGLVFKGFGTKIKGGNHD